MFNVEYDVLDEIKIGTGTHLRLIENIKSKRRSIQLWSPLSKEWLVSNRYDVEENWSAWKRTAAGIAKRKKVSKKRKKVVDIA
jgi:hypothetical protein